MQHSSRDWNQVDQHALQAPEHLSRSVYTLGHYLGTVGKRDDERARAVFRWITANIAYDWEALRDDEPIYVMSDEEILAQRRALCGGYSNLFVALARQAGVRAVKIRGYLKCSHQHELHAWNAVKVADKWQLLDATAASGFTCERSQQWVKQFDDYWFLTSPEAFGFSHFPTSKKGFSSNGWQLRSPVVRLRTFERWPVTRHLLQLGASATTVLEAANREALDGIPLVASFRPPENTSIRNLQAPLSANLVEGTPTSVGLRAHGFSQIAWVQNQRLHPLERNENQFAGTIFPRLGNLQLAGKPHGTDRYYTLLEYRVLEPGQTHVVENKRNGYQSFLFAQCRNFLLDAQGIAQMGRHIHLSRYAKRLYRRLKDRSSSLQKRGFRHLLHFLQKNLHRLQILLNRWG